MRILCRPFRWEVCHSHSPITPLKTCLLYTRETITCLPSFAHLEPFLPLPRTAMSLSRVYYRCGACHIYITWLTSPTHFVSILFQNAHARRLKVKSSSPRSEGSSRPCMAGRLLQCCRASYVQFNVGNIRWTFPVSCFLLSQRAAWRPISHSNLKLAASRGRFNMWSCMTLWISWYIYNDHFRYYTCNGLPISVGMSRSFRPVPCPSVCAGRVPNLMWHRWDLCTLMERSKVRARRLVTSMPLH